MATARSLNSSTADQGRAAAPAARPERSHRKRADSLLRRGLAVTFGLVIVAAAVLGSTQAPASAAVVPGSVDQCNGIQNVGGQGVECDVTITNTLDVSTGISSSVIVVRTCTGAANTALLCTTVPVSYPTATTVVDQCNASGQGGGATVTCRVSVVNNITGNSSTSPATVNQCIGSGGGGGIEPTVDCSPVQSTTNATITQCNGAANGGGDPRRVTCVVEPSTQAAALPVTITQCNNDNVTAPGSFVTCTASITNRILPAEVSPSPTPSATSTAVPPVTGTPAPTAPPTGTPTPTPGVPGTPTAPAPSETPTPSDSPTPAPTDSAAPVAPVSPTPSPTASTPASPLVPVAGGGSGAGSDSPTALAETGTDALPVFLIAGGALLIGGVLLAVMLVRRRRLDALQD